MPTYFLERGCWWQCVRVCVHVCVVLMAAVCVRVCAGGCVHVWVHVRACVRAHVREHVCAWLFLTGIVRILTLKMVGFFQECWPFFFFFSEIIYRLPYYPPPSLIFRFSGFDLGVLLVYMNINMWPLWANTYFPFIFLCNVFLTYDNFSFSPNQIYWLLFRNSLQIQNTSVCLFDLFQTFKSL